MFLCAGEPCGRGKFPGLRIMAIAGGQKFLKPGVWAVGDWDELKYGNDDGKGGSIWDDAWFVYLFGCNAYWYNDYENFDYYVRACLVF